MDYREHIHNLIAQVVKQTYSHECAAVQLTAPPSFDMGDITFPCFELAKVLKKSPVDIAQKLTEIIEADDVIKKLEAENTQLREALQKYREAVVVNVQMDGPKFMGSNASVLKRAWDFDCAALTPTKES